MIEVIGNEIDVTTKESIMYKLKYKCEEITGDTIHSIDVNDSLIDTWGCVSVGEVPKEIAYITTNTHDFNIWYDTNDDDMEELYMTLYPLYYYSESEDQALEVDTANGISCKIVEVICPKFEVPEGIEHIGGDEFINDGEDYFYYNEGHDQIECPICERSCYLHDLIYKKGKVVACTDCEDEE